MSRGLSRQQRAILAALEARPEREQELWSLAHWCHGCLSLEDFRSGEDFCHRKITRSEQVSMARAVRGLEKRGLLQARTTKSRWGKGTWRYSPRGAYYEHETPVRYKLVKLSVSYGPNSDGRKHLAQPEGWTNIVDQPVNLTRDMLK